MTEIQNPADPYAHAVSYLSEVDEDWSRLIKHVGPCMHRPKSTRAPYEALIRAVAYQQLHARAADAIVARFLGLYPGSEFGNAFPLPDEISGTKTEDLRSCGFSMRKVITIQRIAEGASNGLVPSLAAAGQMEDDELIARLMVLPGIGRWTVEMFLMHTLGRMDIMPVDDFGVREGYRFIRSMNVLPDRKEMEKAGLPCSPYRSIASWYLWRATSLPDYVRMTKKK